MKMRIVGLGAHAVIFQENTGNGWKQKQLRTDCFEDYMEEQFPEYWAKFLSDTNGDFSAAEFFYHYGETPEMIRSGEAFIFEK